MGAEPRIDRRAFVRYAGLGAGALILGGVPVDRAIAGRRRKQPTVPLAREAIFPQGIASGDPSPHGIRLWTRLEGAEGDRRLFVEVARDKGFKHVVARRPVLARANRDFTAEARVGKLRPGEQYFYRFETRDRSSPVGRFRTLRPKDSREPVRIALFTCQEWQAGYYGAHSVIADEDVDLVLCQGDYVYEASYQGPRKDTSGADGDGNVQTLADYHSKYRLYRTDKDLQAMHAAHAMVAIWDDHEVSNDYAGNQEGAGLHPAEIPFPKRRRNAYRAFYDYMPIAPIRGHRPRGHALYRRVRIGRTVELFLLDERTYRDPQPCNNAPLRPCAEAESEPRTMLGAEQLEWLKNGLERSRANWKLIGNQVMIMALEVGPGSPAYKDQWDGYGVERRELLGYIQQRGIADVSFLTGDFHMFFAGDVGVDGRGPESVATEFVVGSVTSLSDVDAVGNFLGVPVVGGGGALPYQIAAETNPHIRYLEAYSRGFGLLEANRDELRVTYRGVDALTRNTDSRELGRFRVARGVPRVEIL